MSGYTVNGRAYVVAHVPDRHQRALCVITDDEVVPIAYFREAEDATAFEAWLDDLARLSSLDANSARIGDPQPPKARKGASA